MTCDVIVVSYCSSKQLPACLSAVEKNANELDACRVFVVDNASNDNSVGCVREAFPQVTLIENRKNVGYGAAINRALDQSEADCVLCMNPDVRLRPHALAALLECMKRHPNAIAVAPKLIYPDGAFHAVCRRFPSVWRNFCHVSGLAARLSDDSPSRHWLSKSQHESECDVDMVSGACVLFRRDYLEQIGRFDENIFLYEEESDVFLPTRGTEHRAFYCPNAEAVHQHGEIGSDEPNDMLSFHRLRSKYYIFRKHFGENAARRVYAIDRNLMRISTMRHWFDPERATYQSKIMRARKAFDSVLAAETGNSIR